MHRQWPVSFGVSLAPLGWLLIVLGAAFAGCALLTFWRLGTAIFPNRPATKMAARGPYRLSRNPMYVGLTTLYLGLVALTGIVWPLLVLPLVLWVLWVAVIRREERSLASKFGSEYEAYRRSVRRWL